MVKQLVWLRFSTSQPRRPLIRIWKLNLILDLHQTESNKDYRLSSSLQNTLSDKPPNELNPIQLKLQQMQLNRQNRDSRQLVLNGNGSTEQILQL